MKPNGINSFCMGVVTTIAAILMTGCFPSRELQLTLLRPTHASDNNGISTPVDDSCIVSVNYNGISYGYLDFTLDVANNSSGNIVVGPGNCRCIPLYDPLDTATARSPVAIPSIDPAERLEYLTRERDRVSNETNPYNNLLFAIIHGIAESSNSSLTPEERETQRQKNADEWEINHLREIENIRDQIDFWREEAFWNITLAENARSSKRILFPIQENAVLINVEVMINNHSRETHYRQVIKTKK